MNAATIGNGVTSIGNWAFGDCSSLTSVTLGNSVDSISNAAFIDCISLTSIAIPKSVTFIGGAAFDGCPLSKVVIDSDSIMSVDYNSFRGMFIYFGKNVKEYLLGEHVTKIGKYAFQNCSGMTSVTIPNSVTSIGERAFAYCENLTSITLPNSITSIDGTFWGCSGLTSLVIPNNVTSIGKNAFYNCKSLTSVTIPSSVTSIADYAFANCSSLPSVTIPSSVTSIGKNVFSQCANLAKVTIDSESIMTSTSRGSSMKSIFGGDIKEYVLGEHVTKIGEYAFEDCINLTSVTIPNSVQAIGWGAFNGCTKLTNIHLPNSITSIEFGAFWMCSSLTSITIPSSLTSIGNIFRGCTNLSSVTIPNSITSIEKSAFSDCPLTKVFLDCNEIVSPTDRFIELKSIFGESVVEYVLGDHVTSIGRSAFSDCDSLVSVTIPNSVTRIGEYAFENCHNLKSLTIPESVISIGENAFRGTSAGLEKIVVEEGNPVYDSRENSNAILEGKWLRVGCKNTIIPNDVTVIMDHAFYDCKGLTNITIPNSVEGIYSYAFAGCENLTSITIPNTVKWIESHAFQNCESLAAVTIPNSLSSISGYVFAGCDNLKSVEIPDNVTTIYRNAFQNCTGLTSVIISASVNTINEFVFSGCSSLASIIIPNGVTSIGNSAFSGCSSLTSVIIPNGVTSIGNSAFSDCSGLISVTIPNSVTAIGKSAFQGCGGLEKVIAPDLTSWCAISFGDGMANPLSHAHHLYSDEDTEVTNLVIPEGVTSIGGYAFEDGNYLTSVTIPNTVDTIGIYAFSGCDKLKKVEIPNSVKSIGIGAFKDDYRLHSVTIGNGVESIEHFAFDGDTQLKKVYCHAEKVPNASSTVFVHGGDLQYNAASILESATKSSVMADTTIVYDHPTNVIDGDTVRSDMVLKYDYMVLKGLSNLSNPSASFGLPYVLAGTYDIYALIGYNTSLDRPNKFNVSMSYFSEGKWKSSRLENPNEDAMDAQGGSLYGTTVFVNRGVHYNTQGEVDYVDTICIAKDFEMPYNYFDIPDKRYIDNGASTTDVQITISSSVTTRQQYEYSREIWMKGFVMKRKDTDENSTTVSLADAILYVPASALSDYRSTLPWSGFGQILPLTGNEVDIVPMDEETEIVFEESITEDTDLSSIVIDNVYVTLDEARSDGYDEENECIVLATTMSDEMIAAIIDKDVSDESVKENFNGLIFEVPAGSGTISIVAQTKGTHALCVKIGDGQAQTFVQSERGTVEIPYTVDKDTYVYIYGTNATAQVKHRVSGSNIENGVLIYGIKWAQDESTGINALTAKEGMFHIYTLDGRPTKTLQKGVNIIRMSDGTVKKVWVK